MSQLESKISDLNINQSNDETPEQGLLLKDMRRIDSQPKSTSVNIERIHDILGKKLMIRIADGRTIFGLFKSLDNNGNIILTDSYQYYSIDSPRTRGTSCILVPMHCTVSIQVLKHEPVPPESSDLETLSQPSAPCTNDKTN